MPENQNPEPSVVTNIQDQMDKRNRKAQIERRKKIAKSFVVGAAIGYSIVTAIRMVAEAASYDNTPEENED